MSKKEEILKTASKEFAKYGYNGVSLEKIAKKAGITKAALYYHFKNKAHLYESVVIPKIKELINEIYSFKDKNPKNALKHYIYSFANVFNKYPCFASILAHEFVDGGRNFNEEIIENLSKIFNKLVLILKEGEKKDIFEFDNPFSIQLMIVSALLMNQTTTLLRKRVSKYTEIEINPDIKDIAEAIYKKIIKAISKENK